MSNLNPIHDSYHMPLPYYFSSPWQRTSPERVFEENCFTYLILFYAGSIVHLLNFETERQRVVVPMMAACDGIYRLYSNRNPALVLFRSLGCQAVQSLSPIKVRVHHAIFSSFRQL